MLRKILAVPALLILCAMGCSSPESGNFIAIGTGAVTGVYYPVGGAIAKLIDESPDAQLTASVESTGGSVFNVNAVLVGDLDFGIAQADKQYQAYHGEAEWEDQGPQENLRAVCSLHSEMITLIAAVDSGIESLADLKGKRINIGNPGSGNRGNAIDVLEAAGLDWETDIAAEGLKAAEASKMLQDDRIDAFFYTVGHPNGAISEATAGRREVRFVPITGVDSLVETHPYYSSAAIPMKYYDQAVNEEDVPTVGMRTTLVTSTNVPDDVVYTVTKTIFEHLDTLREQHPALADLDADEMFDGHSAPIHAGAQRYFDEAGIGG